MRLFLAALLGLAVTGSASTQSFSCSARLTPTEATICNNPGLARLDEQVSSMYFRTRSLTDRVGRARLQRMQREFLLRRDRCGSSFECIIDAYDFQRMRLNTFQRAN